MSTEKFLKSLTSALNKNGFKPLAYKGAIRQTLGMLNKEDMSAYYEEAKTWFLTHNINVAFQPHNDKLVNDYGSFYKTTVYFAIGEDQISRVKQLLNSSFVDKPFTKSTPQKYGDKTPDSQNLIIRQVALKASVDFYKDKGNIDNNVVLATAETYVNWINDKPAPITKSTTPIKQTSSFNEAQAHKASFEDLDDEIPF